MAKPYKDFPLFEHQAGQWAKKIRGRTRYFGRIENGWEAALAQYESQREILYAGREPDRTVSTIQLGELINRYLHDLRARVEAGDVGEGHWKDCRRTGRLLTSQFGKTFPVDQLQPSDFVSLRRAWMAKWAGATVGGHVRRTKAMIRWASDPGPLDHDIKTGRLFCEPSAKQLRLEAAAKPEALFEPGEVWQLLDAANPNLRAMILVGLNCGFHTCDIGRLHWRDVDLEYGIIQLVRQKTGIERKAMLWPETIEALRKVKKLGRGKTLVFRTKNGLPVYREDRSGNHVGLLFRRLVKRCKIKPHRSFIAIRKTFQTIGDETGDYQSVRYIMGHADSSMSARYRQRYPEAGLQKVADHVRQWLLSGKPNESSDIKSA